VLAASVVTPLHQAAAGRSPAAATGWPAAQHRYGMARGPSRPSPASAALAGLAQNEGQPGPGLGQARPDHGAPDVAPIHLQHRMLTARTPFVADIHELHISQPRAVMRGARK